MQHVFFCHAWSCLPAKPFDEVFSFQKSCEILWGHPPSNPRVFGWPSNPRFLGDVTFSLALTIPKNKVTNSQNCQMHGNIHGIFFSMFPIKMLIVIVLLDEIPPSSSSYLYIWNQGSIITWYIDNWELGSQYIGNWKIRAKEPPFGEFFPPTQTIPPFSKKGGRIDGWLGPRGEFGAGVLGGFFFFFWGGGWGYVVILRLGVFEAFWTSSWVLQMIWLDCFYFCCCSCCCC